MMKQFRSLVKRLELQPQESSTVVYRIIDRQRNIVEVSPSEYAIWRMQNDVARQSVVGQDTVGEVMVRTTFSIMPEDRTYKPFGTAAFELPMCDPLPEHSRRYDTWQEAEQGHRETVELIRKEIEEGRAHLNHVSATDSAESQDVRHAIQSGLPGLFEVIPRGGGIVLQTPFLLPGGSTVNLLVAREEDGFSLSALEHAAPADSSGKAGSLVDELCDHLGVSHSDGHITAWVEEPSQLPRAAVALAQAIVCSSYMAR